MALKPKKWLMSIFGVNYQNNEEETEVDPTHTMIIPRGTNVTGRIIGNDSVHLDGYYQGNIKVNNIVILGTTGELYGDIKAQRVIINGHFQGDIIADSVEILEKGKCEGKIQANKVLIKGHYKGKLLAGGLFIDAGGETYADAQIKKVVVAGLLEGNVACKELRTLPTCVLRGKMFADEIQNEGGRIEGYIGRYTDLAAQDQEMAYYLNIFNSRSDYILLEDKEYEVDVEEELKKEKEQGENECIEVLIDNKKGEKR